MIARFSDICHLQTALAKARVLSHRLRFLTPATFASCPVWAKLKRVFRPLATPNILITYLLSGGVLAL
jgi:hypothetical protein